MATFKLVTRDEQEVGEWVKAVIKYLNQTIKYLKTAQNATGVAVCITHADGSVSTTFSGDNHFQLLGGLDYLKDEILESVREAGEHE